MIGYILLFIILLISSRDANNNYKSYTLMGIVLFLFCALRYEIGFDYCLYTNLMHGYALKDLNYTTRMEELEPISSFLLRVCSQIDTHLFFVISSAIIIGGFLYAIKKSSTYPVESVWLFIALPFFFMDSLSIVRNAMAYVCVFLAMVLFDDKEKGKWYKLALVIAAFMFHSSGIIGLLIFLPWQKIKLTFLWGIFIGSLVLGFSVITPVLEYIPFLGSYIADQFDIYINGDLELQGGNLMKILILGLTLVILFFYERICLRGEKYAYYMGLIVIGGSFYAMFLDFPHVGQRFCTYFFSPLLIVLPTLLHSLKINKQLIIVGCLSLFIIYTKNMHDGTVDNKGKSAVYPYRTIVERD